jgi:hypothetical protein
VREGHADDEKNEAEDRQVNRGTGQKVAERSRASKNR